MWTVGYVYIHFESERSVKSLLLACTHDFSNGGEYYYKISSKRMRSKEVSVFCSGVVMPPDPFVDFRIA